MICHDARERLYRCDLARIEAEDEVLAAHLGECAACAERLRRLQGAEAAAREAYRALTPAESATPVIRLPLRRRPLARRMWVPIGAAAAAGLALALVRWTGRPLAPVTDGTPPARAARPVEVEVPPGQNAMVLKTSDPDIDVVWLY